MESPREHITESLEIEADAREEYEEWLLDEECDMDYDIDSGWEDDGRWD